MNRGLLALALIGCVPRPAPSWTVEEQLPRACRDAGLPRSAAAARVQLREAAQPQVRLHAWSTDEIEAAVGRRPELPDNLVLVLTEVSVAATRWGPVTPSMHIELEAQEWPRCTDCGPTRLAQMLGEYTTEERLVDPPPKQSKSPSRRKRRKLPKGPISAVLGLVLVPVEIVVGGVVAVGEAVGGVVRSRPAAPRGPHTEVVKIWGGEATDRFYALSHPPACRLVSNETCTIGGLFAHDYHKREDPIRHDRDRVSVVLDHNVGEGCTVRDVLSFPVSPGLDGTSRLQAAWPAP